MSDVRFLTYPVFQAFDDNGNPLSGGKVNVYSAGTTDRIDTWTDADQGTKNANPVILNSRGEADIWFDAPAKIVLTDSSDVTVKTIDDVSPLNAQTLTGQYNLVENGSFELDGDGDGKPDSWDIVETTSTSTVEIDTSTVAHGSNSLKFVSGGGGGGTATTSEKFPVADGEDFSVSFFVAATTTTATNKVDVIFYDSAGTNPSTSNVYTSSGTSPSSLTRKNLAVTVPSGKSQAEVKLSGVTNATSATTYFDFVQATDGQIGGYAFTGASGEITADAKEIDNSYKASLFTITSDIANGSSNTTVEPTWNKSYYDDLSIGTGTTELTIPSDVNRFRITAQAGISSWGGGDGTINLEIVENDTVSSGLSILNQTLSATTQTIIESSSSSWAQIQTPILDMSDINTPKYKLRIGVSDGTVMVPFPDYDVDSGETWFLIEVFS